MKMKEFIGEVVSYEGIVGIVRDYSIDTRDGNISVLLKIDIPDNDVNEEAFKSYYKQEKDSLSYPSLSIRESFGEWAENFIIDAYNDGISINDLYLFDHD